MPDPARAAHSELLARHHTDKEDSDELRSGAVQDHDPPAVGGRRRGLAPLGTDLEGWLGEATERMLDAAGVRSGSQVLDVAAGAGGQTLAAARRAGPSGRVVATDISPTILTYAAKAAAEAGLTNVETARGRRRGPRRAGARHVRRGDLPGRADLLPRPAASPGRDAPGAARRRPDRRDRLLDPRPQRVLLGPGVDHPRPGPAARRRSRASPDRSASAVPACWSRLWPHAGFRDVTVEAVPAPLRLPSAAECVRFERESFGALHQMLVRRARRRAARGLGRDRDRVDPVRDAERVRRPVRAARGRWRPNDDRRPRGLVTVAAVQAAYVLMDPQAMPGQGDRPARPGGGSGRAARRVPGGVRPGHPDLDRLPADLGGRRGLVRPARRPGRASCPARSPTRSAPRPGTPGSTW